MSRTRSEDSDSLHARSRRAHLRHGCSAHGCSAHAHNDDRHFDLWARTYDRSITQVVFFGPIQRVVARIVAARTSAGASAGRVLDIGAGTGRLLERLGHELRRPELVGLDRSSGMVNAAHRARPQLSFVRGAAEELPFPDESFDVVTSTLSFHHWSDPPAALAEVRRVLRSGGVLALADVTVDDLPRWGFVRALASGALGNRPSLEERHRLLEDAGLQVVDQRRAFCGRWIPLTLAQRTPT